MAVKSYRRAARTNGLLKQRAVEEFDFGAVEVVRIEWPDFMRYVYQKRQESRADRFDEVWDGVYIVAPPPTTDHQRSIIELVMAFREAVGNSGEVLHQPGVTDREKNWSKNYREPDVCVILKTNTQCVDRQTHFLGGPDFIAELESPGDRSREKFDFYAKIGVREYLIIEHGTRQPLLYRLAGDAFEPVEPEQGVVRSQVLPLAFSDHRGKLVLKLTRKPFTRWTV